MPLKIAQLGQPILRQVADPVSEEEIASPAFQQLVQDMLETLAQEAGEDVHPGKLTKAEASKKIDQLQDKTGRGD